MAGEFDKKVGSAVEALWGTLHSVRGGAGWERKLLAASYVHHRDGYIGTEVPYRETYDPSAVEFLNTFLDGFVGYMMPRDDTWLDVIPMSEAFGRNAERRRWGYASIKELDQKPKVLEFAERCVQAALTVYANTDYYPEVRMAAKDYLVTGTGYLMACDDDGRGVYYRCFDPQEVCIAEDHRRVVDVFVRKFTMDARDVIRAYPEKEWTNLRRAVVAGGGEHSAVDLYEAIVPRRYLTDGREFIDFGDGGAFVHVLYVPVENQLAFVAGFERFPVAAVRRNRDNSKTPYGIGLVEECLSTIVEIDDMGRLRQVMRQKNADPPMVLPYSMEGHYSSRPGARNYVSDMANRPMPVQDAYNASELLADIQDLRAQLREMMGADLFRAVMSSTDSRKTAYEVSERKNEAMTLLQMQIGTFKQELVDPVFKRTLYIMEKQHIISFEEYQTTVKDSSGYIQGSRSVTFESWLDAAHVELNSVFVRRVEAFLQYQQNLQSLQMLVQIQQIFPSALLNVDENAYIRSLLYGSGLPKMNMRSPQEVKEKQAQYEKSLRDQAQMNQVEQASKAMKNLEGSRGEGGVA